MSVNHFTNASIWMGMNDPNFHDTFTTPDSNVQEDTNMKYTNITTDDATFLASIFDPEKFQITANMVYGLDHGSNITMGSDSVICCDCCDGFYMAKVVKLSCEGVHNGTFHVLFCDPNDLAKDGEIMSFQDFMTDEAREEYVYDPSQAIPMEEIYPEFTTNNKENIPMITLNPALVLKFDKDKAQINTMPRNFGKGMGKTEFKGRNDFKTWVATVLAMSENKGFDAISAFNPNSGKTIVVFRDGTGIQARLNIEVVEMASEITPPSKKKETKPSKKGTHANPLGSKCGKCSSFTTPVYHEDNLAVRECFKNK